jgi:hypothetical protein
MTRSRATNAIRTFLKYMASSRIFCAVGAAVSSMALNLASLVIFAIWIIQSVAALAW